MKTLVINYVKRNRFIYLIYVGFYKIFLAFIKLFVKTDEKTILFMSFGGRSYNDSPKAVFEYMKKDSRFNGFNFIWAFRNTDCYESCDAKKVKIDSLSFYLSALKARVWIGNSGIDRGIGFKGKKTFYVNTWHGTPIKKIGLDMEQTLVKFTETESDVFCVQGNYEINPFSSAFGIKDQKVFIKTGLPRNDVLVNVNENVRYKIRERLNLSVDKKIILYAPTYREYQTDKYNNVTALLSIDFGKWREQLSEKFVLLFRAHYEMVKVINLHENDEFIIDVSDYPDINDLYIAADLLISDYSSSFFDFSITGKPMICFPYDYDEYAEKRGVYFDIRNELPFAYNEDDVIDLIKRYMELVVYSSNFRKKYVNFLGGASEKVAEIILDELNHR